MTEPKDFDEACEQWASNLIHEEPVPQVIDLKQVIHALERARDRLQAEADAMEPDDYSAEFPAEDADRMREAIILLQAIPITQKQP